MDSVASVERGECDAPITVCITLDGKSVTTEVDTGAAKRLRENILEVVAREEPR